MKLDQCEMKLSNAGFIYSPFSSPQTDQPINRANQAAVKQSGAFKNKSVGPHAKEDRDHSTDEEKR
jgi:hypothetical protein